jgi:B12-binding domain/radical SAM domain protein
MSRFKVVGTSCVLWIAGGPHPTADPEGTLRLGFDAVVLGEGEATLVDLLKTIAADGDLAEVPGLAIRGSSGRTRFTGRRPPVDLDAYPPFPLRRRRAGPIEITRGCPFACGYCQTSHLLGTLPRHRSIETITRYAGVIRGKSACDIRVITPNAFSYGSPDGRTLNLAALESLLAALRRTLGADGRLFFGTFPSEVRPEHVNRAALELVKRFANNDHLIIGAQTGSARLLEQCRRGHTVADVFSAVSRTLAAGLKPHVDFIFGLPGETEEDLNATIGVIRELAAMGALIHAHTFMPLPQTRFAKERPGRIHGRLRAVLRELTHSGALYGIWRG